MIDLPPQDLKTIKLILAEHVPDREVRAFGSRVTGTARPHSDLDLVIVGTVKLPQRLYYRLKEVFQESNLPFRVDILDWQRIAPEFRNIIEEKYVVVQKADYARDEDSPMSDQTL